MATRRSPIRSTDSPPGIDHLTVVPENHESHDHCDDSETGN